MKTSTEIIKVTKFEQYYNAAIMCLTALANSMIVQSLVTINTEVCMYIKGATPELISFSALMFMIIHPFSTFPANYILDNYSLKIGISINCILVIMGCVIRLFIAQNVSWLIVGNFLVAIGNTFVLNSPAKFSSIWFYPHQRLLITSMIIFSSVISGGFGSFLSPFFVHENQSISDGKKQVQDLMFFHLYFVGGIMILNLLALRTDPYSKSPFSLIKRTIIEQQPQGTLTKKDNSAKQYFLSVKKLLGSRDFLIPFFAVAFCNSVLNNFVTNIELYLKPFGMGSKQAGSSSIVALLAGLINTVVFSIIIRKTRKYKKGTIIMFICCTLSLTFLIFFGLFLGLRFAFWISLVLFGLSAIPILSTIIEATCETNYPVGQATITGLILVGQALTSFFLGMANTAILSSGQKSACYISFSINIAFLLAGLTLYSFADVKLNRMVEQQKKIKEDETGQKQNQQSQDYLKESLISENQQGEVSDRKE